MLESVVSNKVSNIGPSFSKNCDVKYNIGTWFESENLISVCSNSNRSYRKRFYPSTFEKDHQHNQSSEGLCKRRKEYINRQSDLNLNYQKNLRNSKSEYYRKKRESGRMTRTSCCQIRRHNDSRYFNNGNENIGANHQRNRSLSQSNVGVYHPHHQMSLDDSSDLLRSATSNRRNLNHPNILHQISSNSPHSIFQGKEALTVPNPVNNYCNGPSSQIAQSAPACGLQNHYQMSTGNSSNYRQSHQTNVCTQQTSRRRHHTSDMGPLFESGGSGYSSTQYLQSRPMNLATSQTSNPACSMAVRTLSANTSPFPLVTRSFCHNPHQLRFATAATAAATTTTTNYPINPYPTSQHHQQQQQQQQQAMFTRTTVPATTIMPHSSAFCSATVQMPTLIGDIMSSTPCHQCAIMASSTALNGFSNGLSSMFQFSVAPTPANLITLAAVSAGDRIHGSRLSYVPVHAINNWHNHHPYLPAAWSYNDLSSILHNSTARHILQDHLTQRLLSTSPNVSIQLVMMTPSSVLGAGDGSQVRHHLIPVSRTDPLSPIAVSRYLPIIDHLPLVDQPRPGITKHELDQIPIRKFVKLESVNHLMIEDDDNEDRDRCMICLEDFKENEIIRILKCSHDFHSSCVERWLKINRTCPLCRADAVGLGNRKS